jgi:hypothetical protein
MSARLSAAAADLAEVDVIAEARVGTDQVVYGSLANLGEVVWWQAQVLLDGPRVVKVDRELALHHPDEVGVVETPDFARECSSAQVGLF